MAELRVKSTGTLKLFESDNTSSVTIASPASLGADRTITLPDGDVTLVAGTMSTGGVALTGSTNNTVVTVTGADAIAGEANLTFDGTDLTVSTGNVVIGTAGKGIDFSAQTGSGTSGATTDAEILDHYEEGTFTAALTSSGSATDGGSKYVRIGRVVYWQGKLTSFTSVTDADNTFFFGGLPFACGSSQGDYGGGGFLYYSGANFSAPLSEYGEFNSSLGNTKVYMHKISATAGATLFDSDVVACSNMTCSGWYFTDA
jgi:hypothetical protein